MKILIFAPYFPPYNAIGSVRASNFVRFLLSQNADVRVISAIHPELDQSQTLPIPPDKVTFVSWSDSNPQYRMQKQSGLMFDKSIQKRPLLFNFLRVTLRSILYWPDRHQFWIKSACEEADSLISGWKPDLIFASALPASALLAASRTSRAHNIPWVAEFRDLWAGNEFNETWFLKRLFEEFWEKRIISSSSQIVTVSEHLALVLKERHARNVDVILNGFFKKNVPDNILRNRKKIVIRHTGSLYGGKRNPSTLFSAISKLGKDKKYFLVEFYGPEYELVNQLAKKHGVDEVVKGFPKVSYKDCEQLQASADILLLVMWNDIRERDIYTGKFFEYVSTENPILLIGRGDTSLAKKLCENRLGVAALSELEIFEFLKAQLIKFRNGKSLRRVKSLSEEKFSSHYQFSILHQKLIALIEKSNQSNEK